MARTTITKQIVAKCKELATKGFNNKMIASSLKVSYTTLSKNKKLKQSIQDGRMELAEEVINSVVSNLDETQTRLFIAKRLGLFNPIINIKAPKNAKDALDNLSGATKQYSEGEINESQLRTIEAVSNSYIKGYDFIEFERRLEELEKMRQ